MNDYILVEVWRARDAWLELSKEQREEFLEKKLNPFLGKMVAQGAELFGCVLNENEVQRLDYTYMAIWKLRDKVSATELEEGAKAVGFLEYFEQKDISGKLISPAELNQAMSIEALSVNDK